MVPIMVDMYLA